MIVCPFCDSQITRNEYYSTLVRRTHLSITTCRATDCTAAARALTPGSKIVKAALGASAKGTMREKRGKNVPT